MREIKFRAWDSKHNLMHYSKCSKVSVEKDYKVFYPWGFIMDKDVQVHAGFLTIMQYTGLGDKNGEDIYEGDVVRIRTKNRHPKNLSDEELKEWCEFIEEITADYALVRDTVEWRTCGFGFMGIASCDMQANTEIIGNIYENPELLDK